MVVLQLLELQQLGRLDSEVIAVPELALFAAAEGVDLLREGPQHDVAASAGHFHDSLVGLRKLDELHAAVYDFVQPAVVDAEPPGHGRADPACLPTGTLIDDLQFVIEDVDLVDPALLVRLDEDGLLQRVELGVHAPQVQPVGRRRHRERLRHLQTLQRTVLLEAVLDDLEVIEQPAVLRIAVLHVDKGLEVYNEVKKRALFLELLEVVVVEYPERVVDLILV